MSEPIVITMTREEMQQLVREAVREELHDVGMRVDSAEGREATREDLRFARRLRLTIDGAASKIGMAVITVIVGGVSLALWEGFKLLSALGLRPPLP